MADAMLLMNANSGVTPAAFEAAMQGNGSGDDAGAGPGSSEDGTDPSFVESDPEESDAGSVMAAAPARKGPASTSGRGSPVRRQAAPSGPSAAQMAAMKGELLFRLDRLAKRGLRPPRPMTVDDRLEDIQVEFDRLDREAKVDKAVEFQRGALITFANGIEMLSGQFNPLGLKLDGWSEHVNDGIDSYDDVFQQLGEKYGMGTSSMPPEVSLLLMVASSGFMFHMQATMFKQAPPELDEVMREDPELAQHIAAATARMMKKKEAAARAARGGGGGGGGMASFMSAMMGGGGKPGAAPVRGPATEDVDEYLRQRVAEVDLFSDDSEDDDGSDGQDSVLNEVNAAVRSGRSLTIDA